MLVSALKAKYQNITDTNLAAMVAAGDEDAFHLLMRRHNQKMYRTARSILRDDAEAEDAVQVAYLQAYMAIAKFRDEAQLATWLVRIVVNVAIAHARRHNREAKVIFLDNGATNEYASEEGNMDTSPAAQPEQQVLRAELRRILESRISALPDVFRTVFILRAVEEMSVDEVALCLDIPAATVRTRFFRARSLLREGLAQQVDYDMTNVFAFDGVRCDRIIAGVFARIKEIGRN
jgi:RNA polymerase sigma-70 factor (ECF subfamily)